jgi:molecular chaperone DnaK
MNSFSAGNAMSKAIGIDLGTTNSAAAIKRLETVIIPNAEGDPLTPSVVSSQGEKGFFRKQTKFVVGKAALDWMAQDPANTILSIKRLMGRNFTDPEVQKLIEEKRFAYTVKRLDEGSEHSVGVELHGEEFTPEQISAKILEKVVTDAEKRLKETVEYGVVTVPAYFNDKQKHATRMAAALAGLKVQRLLPEPTAAAISFGLDAVADKEAQTILVFDLGGGTFDIAILTLAQGQFIEQGKGGDMWMGGDDIDHLITQYVYDQTAAEYDIEDVAGLIDDLPVADKNRFLSDLKRKVEAAKIRLSTHDKAVIEILGLLKDEDGDILDIEVELSRPQFEALLLPLAEQAVALTLKVIEDIHFDIDLIDKVVMVGGSSSIPLLIRKMQEVFGEPRVLVHPRPMLAIAEGAAALAHRLSESYECPCCGQMVAQTDARCGACQFDLTANLEQSGVVDIVHTVSHDYYLALEDGSDYCLVEQNTPLPFKTQAAFKLMHADQRLAHFKFYNRVNTVQESIGDLWLSFSTDGVGNDEGKVHEVLLDFDIDENNLITVSASLKDLPAVKVSRTLSRGNVDEKLFLDLEASIARVNSGPHSYYAVLDFLERAVGMAQAINQVIDPETGEIHERAHHQVMRQQFVAKQLVEQDATPYANLYYAEDFLADAGQILPPREQRAIQQKIDRLKAVNETGSVDDILSARDGLSEELDKHPLLLSIKNIELAASIVAEQDPAKAPRYLQYVHNIRGAIERHDLDRLFSLIDEIMPEVSAILNQYESKELRIWKEIRQ